MTGTRWLERAQERYGTGLHLRKRMEQRISQKVRAMSADEAREALESFRGLNSVGSRDMQIALVGCWSQSLDHHLRLQLGRRVLRG